MQFKNIAPGHIIRQWRKILCSPASKTNLIEFIVEEWKKAESREKLKKRILYVTCGNTCFKITKEMWKEVNDLKSD